MLDYECLYDAKNIQVGKPPIFAMETLYIMQKMTHLAVEMIVILLKTDFGVLLNVMLLKC